MSTLVLETLARDFYQQTAAGNRQGVQALMHPDFRFSGPDDDHLDATAYFTKYWQAGDNLKDFAIEKLAVTGQFVFVQYAGTGENNRTRRSVAILTVEEDKVRTIQVYSGDRPS